MPGERDRRGTRRSPCDEVSAEERHALTRERAGRDCAAVDHHDLARRREDGVDDHQPEDRVDARVADPAGDGARDRGDHHRRDFTRAQAATGSTSRGGPAICRTVNVRTSSTVPELALRDDVGAVDAALDALLRPVEPVPDDRLVAGVVPPQRERADDLARPSSRP